MRAAWSSNIAINSCRRQFANISDLHEDGARIKQNAPESPVGTVLPIVTAPEDFVLGNGEDGVADEALMMSQELHDLLAVCIEIWKPRRPRTVRQQHQGRI